MSNLLGRATRRERIKNKDQALAGTQSQLRTFSLPARCSCCCHASFHPWSAQKCEEGQQNSCIAAKRFKPLQPREKRQGAPRRAARQLREQAACGSVVVPLLGHSPLQSWEPSVSLELQLVRLVGWEFSKSTPCYSGSFGASNYAGWNVTSLLQML